MRGYDDFAARLRREIEGQDLGSAEPRFAPPARKPRRSASAPWSLAAAAALLAAAGIGGYAGYSALDGRRTVRQDNREFVDSLFARGLFEAASGPSAGDSGLLDWSDAGETGDSAALD